MFLFVLESLGTWELMLVGLVVLVIFGPRKIPELARKAGKIMSEFRKVSNEFRSTWEKEAGLDEDEKNAFNFDEETIARDTSMPEEEHPSLVEAGPEAKNPTIPEEPAVPEIKEITDEEQLEKLKSSASTPVEETSDKENWF